jgi:hypothetical protein
MTNLISRTCAYPNVISSRRFSGAEDPDNVSPAILDSYRSLLGALTRLSRSSPNCSTPVTFVQSHQSQSRGGGSIACSCILEGLVSLGCKSLQSTDMDPGLPFSIRRRSWQARQSSNTFVLHELVDRMPPDVLQIALQNPIMNLEFFIYCLFQADSHEHKYSVINLNPILPRATKSSWRNAVPLRKTPNITQR